jgi:hypothetical protein
MLTILVIEIKEGKNAQETKDLFIYLLLLLDPFIYLLFFAGLFV